MTVRIHPLHVGVTAVVYAVAVGEFLHRDAAQAYAASAGCLHENPRAFHALAVGAALGIYVVSTVIFATGKGDRGSLDTAINTALSLLGGVLLGALYLAVRPTLSAPNCPGGMALCGPGCFAPVPKHMVVLFYMALIVAAGAAAVPLGAFAGNLRPRPDRRRWSE